MHFRAILLTIQLSLLSLQASSDCTVSQCQLSQISALYPYRFSVWGAYRERAYCSGETAFIVAQFPAAQTCSLPEPFEAGPECTPLISLGVRFADGSNCLSIRAANSTRRVEIDYGIKFISDSNLDSGGTFNFWVFPLEVRDGMYTSQLSVLGFSIPSSCNIPGRAIFNNLDLIPKGNHLLTPNVSIDTFPPKIVSVFTGKPNGTYTHQDVINIIVEFSKPVYFSELPSKYGTAFMVANASYTLPVGLPYLELNSQAIAVLEGYEAVSLDRRRLSFLYVVGTGEFTPPGGQLEVPAGATIQLNKGTISDLATGLEADLTSTPLPGTMGSMSSPHSPKIVITQTGEKFPPHGYDPTAPPSSVVVNATRRNGQIHVTRRAGNPILVAVNLQLNSLFNLAERSQQLSADFTLVSTWLDPRLADPKKPAATTTDMGPLDKGLMWGPKLTFTNRRDLTSPIEGVLTVTNQGRVTVIQRYIAAYSVALNIRDFPFDTQTFQWNIRSSTYTKDTLVFEQATADVVANASAQLEGVLNPTFAFSGYQQRTYTVDSGIYANFHVLSISFQAKRLATMSSIFLIFPLCLVCLALVLVLSQEPAKDSRLVVPASGITATMYFSFVVSNLCPPVSYVTRLHLLIFQTYIFATAELCFNYYLWRIQAARKELAANNTANKNLLNDAHWMPRKILPPPTNVVVLPDGVYKPADKKKIVPETGKISKEEDKLEPAPTTANAQEEHRDKVADSDPQRKQDLEDMPPPPPPRSRQGSEEATAEKLRQPGDSNLPAALYIAPAPPAASLPRILFPPYAEPHSEAQWNTLPEPSPSPSQQSARQIRSVSADVVLVESSPAPADSSDLTSAQGPLQLPRQAGTAQTVWTVTQEEIALRVMGTSVQAQAVVTAASGTLFGGVGGAPPVASAPPDAAGAAEPKKKGAADGAYPDKSGEYKDVMDLLDSAEVKTFKKLRWGGADVKMFWGLLKVTNANDSNWKAHVERLNARFNFAFSALVAVSIGCILGVPSLAGLPDPHLPVVGTPDPSLTGRSYKRI